MTGRKRQKRSSHNESNKEFRRIGCCQYLLKAKSKVVYFDSGGISLQDSQGDQPVTRIHRFREKGKSKSKLFVTLSQKSRNRFRILTKSNGCKNVKLSLYTDNDFRMLVEAMPEQHLFVKNQREECVEFKCCDDDRHKYYLYADENLSMQEKMDDDSPGGQNYLFKLEKKNNSEEHCFRVNWGQ